MPLIGRQTRTPLYGLAPQGQGLWIAREDIIGVRARRTATGNVLAPLDEGAIAEVRRQAAGYEAAAISLLFSFAAPDDERRLKEALGDVLWVSCSHEVAPIAGEYERLCTTFLNAFTGPLAGRYLAALKTRVPAARIEIMHSAGGVIGTDEAARLPVALALSGPAGGVAAAHWLGNALGEARLLTFDMGGTSTDVAAIHEALPLAPMGEIAGVPIALPMLAIHTIGAGGGSIAWLDEAGLLRVGPQSAGADPGPVCYRRGGAQPTVTDANLVLGRMPEAVRLGGRMRLDAAAATQALARLGARKGLSPIAAAEAVVEIAEEAMAGALRVVSIERGLDPRTHTLVCFGGAGGLHALALAERLGIRRVVLPVAAGAFSALGMLAAERRHAFAQTIRVPLDAPDADQRLRAAMEALGQRAQAAFPDGEDARWALEVRYLGQGEGLPVPWRGSAASAAEDFAAAHRDLFGHTLARPVEAVRLELQLATPTPPFALPEL
ncbi:MAG: hydantoinase/oxoprolinase family protein, partial [Zetaproteobacteria bacterium]